MQFDDVILGRRSIRGYKPDPVPRALIEEIIGLAMRAPSSMNTQPWNFYIITGKPLDQIVLATPSGWWRAFRSRASSAPDRALQVRTVTGRLASPSNCSPPWELRLALEHVAERVGDAKTAKLSASIRADEERMLARVMRELKPLSLGVVGAEVDGDPSYDLSETGAADAVKATARTATAKSKRAARKTRTVPGVAQVEGEVKGVLASAEDLAIARYDQLTAEEIAGKLGELSQIDLAKVDAYERKGENRTTVLSRISSLRGDEPWPGYDELGVQEIRIALDDADDDRVAGVRGMSVRTRTAPASSTLPSASSPPSRQCVPWEAARPGPPTGRRGQLATWLGAGRRPRRSCRNPLVARHEPDHLAAGGLYDDLLEARAHHPLEGHALADHVFAVGALEQGLLDAREAAAQQAHDEIVVDVDLGPVGTAPRTKRTVARTISVIRSEPTGHAKMASLRSRARPDPALTAPSRQTRAPLAFRIDAKPAARRFLDDTGRAAWRLKARRTGPARGRWHERDEALDELAVRRAGASRTGGRLVDRLAGNTLGRDGHGVRREARWRVAGAVGRTVCAREGGVGVPRVARAGTAWLSAERARRCRCGGCGCCVWCGRSSRRCCPTTIWS